MIIQKVIKGISGQISRAQAVDILSSGIICNWWRNINPLPDDEITIRLTERNIFWHQNHYEDPDPLQSDLLFYERTPFISTTAGTVERDAIILRNTVIPAWQQALNFATDFSIRDDGYLYYCYVFILGKKAIGHRNFAEELRELNIYLDFSPFQLEGEITAKIIIPPQQIEKLEHWSLKKIEEDISMGIGPQPVETINNPLYLPENDYSNIRELLL